MMSQAETVKSKMVEMLPMLADFAKNEEALLAALMGLYDAGVTDGRALGDRLLKSMTTDIAVIVTMHVQKDAVGLKAALDDFVARRVIVTKGVSINTHSVH